MTCRRKTSAGGVLVGAGHQHEALVGQTAGAVEQRLVESDGEARCHVGVEQRVLLGGALAEGAERYRVAAAGGEQLRVAAGIRGRVTGGGGNAGDHHGIQRAGDAVPTEAEADGGVEGSGRADGDRAAAAGDAARVTGAPGAAGAGDARADGAGVQLTGKQRAGESAGGLSGFRAQNIGLRKRYDVALHHDVEIVFERQGDGVGDGEFEFPVADEGGKAR